MTRLGYTLRAIISELKRPDDFGKDWYGYATNQLAHFVLGFSTACALSFAHLYVFGEFSDKVALWALIALLYAGWELIIQKSSRCDAIEDWTFYAVYGAGGAIFLFNEVEPGKPDLITSMEYIPPFMVVFYGHLITGVVVRIWQGSARR